MSAAAPAPPDSGPHLKREFSLLQATALNMTNMVGIGPFITLPLLMTALGGPQAMLGWGVALIIALPDALVWSELGAALPGSGGSYRYLREGFGRETFGRWMAFLFIWQFLLSGPLEIASGYIGFAQYAGYVWHGLDENKTKLLAAVLGLVNIILLYRQIRTIGPITVGLWIGTLVTTGVVILTGASHFNPHVAFDFPPGAFNFSLGFAMGLGTASRIALYDYLGYYDVCYLGDEVKDPGRVIPRSILISLVSVAVIYFAINLSIIGVVPWREFVPFDAHPAARFVVSIFMERIYGPHVAALFTLLVLWTTFGSVFALLLGYSRIPYAAARDGAFFPVFARLHPTRGFPALSLLVIGAIAIACSLFDLSAVIDALIATRILVQFIGQAIAVMLLRRRAPDLPRPYRIWLYPLPPLLAIAGWLFIFLTTGRPIILLSLGMLGAGALCMLLWSWQTAHWPFTPAPGGGG